jgi:Domain of unknown function (DUF4234)
MKHRNPFLVFFLPFVTLGIYSWYWYVSTKNEMNKMGEHIPTAWIWLIPFFGGIWWVWKYSEAVGHVTKDKLGGIFAFLLIFFLGMIGHAIIQDFFNKIGASPTGTPATPVQPGQPAQPMPTVPPAPAPQQAPPPPPVSPSSKG